jgi:hypothetical protein
MAWLGRLQPAHLELFHFKMITGERFDRRAQSGERDAAFPLMEVAADAGFETARA